MNGFNDLRKLLPAGILLWVIPGCGAHHAISGQVVDRNGEPIDRAIISLDPGGVELITDQEGYFMIDYLRDSEGKRIKLNKKTEYELEAFRTGYHITGTTLYYKKGELIVDPITMAPDTIRVNQSDENIDPVRFKDRTQSTGANYEGE